MIPENRCLRCKHIWLQRTQIKPKVCPQCNSPYWNRKRIIEKHGMRNTRFYRIWCGMKSRCLNPNSNDYNNYGAKGVKVWEKWMLFGGFYEDMYSSYLKHLSLWGEMNTTLDRINNKNEYSKKNCKWATKKEQSINKTHGLELRHRNKLGRFTAKEI